MELRRLGRTGTRVSELALGTMTFGAESDEDEAHALLDHYVEAGGTLIDTADVYSAGASEEMVGRWLAKRGRADDLVLATKGRFPMGPGPNDRGLSRPYLRRALHASLRRLQVDAVDLYQVHCWDPLTPLEETLAALDELVREGLVRYVGISNFAGWQLQRAVLLARHNGWAPPVTLQPQYNLLGREIEWEVVPVCLAEGLGLLPWGPLGGGWLTGKYDRSRRPEGRTRLGEDPGRGIEAYDRRNTERTWRVVDALRAVADAHEGATPAQVAIRWVTDRPAVSSTILGARTVAQLTDNLAAADLRLAPEETAALDAASEVPLPDYPYGFIHDESRR
jgi:aryl-alcohol dehydrogenase-like predicted oxidoreductase